MRVSTLDQHPETQLYDLHEMAKQRGYLIVEEYTDMISGAKARRPGLDTMMRDARRSQFDVVLVWASDRIARSVKHFLEVLDELNRLNVEFISFREQIDTGGPLGRAVVVIIGAIAELERSLIVERVRAGMRRAKFEGRHIGRKALVLDRAAIHRDRQQGHSLGQTGEKLSCQPHDHPPSARRANPGRYKRARKTDRVNLTESGPDLTDPAVP
jgi:DNA invertase Pin-like site-specific DNA recombinase